MPDAILEARISPVFIQNVLYYPFVIESLCLYLHCLSAALLCYTGFQNQSLIRSTSCSCSTCCFGLGFQLQNLQDFIKISRALIEDIFLGPQKVWSYRSKKTLTAWTAPWVGSPVGTSFRQGSFWTLSTSRRKTTRRRMCFLGGHILLSWPTLTQPAWERCKPGEFGLTVAESCAVPRCRTGMVSPAIPPYYLAHGTPRMETA